jgi:lipoprotein LpqS
MGPARAATVGNIVRYDDARTGKRLLSAVALAVASWVLVIAAECGVTWSDAPTAHAPHAVASAPGAEFAAILEHPHMQDGSVPAVPDILADAVVLRAITVLVALGLLAVVVVLAGSSGGRSWLPCGIRRVRPLPYFPGDRS